jgi:arginine/lysine/ornithine decarboxylase
MASLEAGNIYMGTDGHKHIDSSLKTILTLHSRITDELSTLSVLWKEEWHQDPFKLYITSAHLSGADMDEYLREHFAIYSEMHDNNGILFILPIQTTPEWANQLFIALKALDQYSSGKAPCNPIPSFYCNTIPEQVLPLRDAFYAPKTNLPWRDAAGKIAGQFILRYPPGIPMVVPGERITDEIVQLWLAADGSADETVTIIM